jgi:23S rRNA pseudouridine2605 synthase
MIAKNHREPGPVHPKLQKVLAEAGVASRRGSETLISTGRVSVNGELVTRLGVRVDPTTDVIRVDGARIPTATAHVYLVLNKPLGVVSTMSDPHGRPSLGDLVADRPERLFHVGRLDTDTEGLLILTNDGEFAHRMAHPSFGVRKTYVAQVPGPVSPKLRARLLEGVMLEDGPVAVDAFRVISAHEDKAIVEVVLHEGRNRIVRRLLEQVGHPVQRLSRTGLGPIRIGRLGAGEYRLLSTGELGTLLDDLRL